MQAFPFSIAANNKFQEFTGVQKDEFQEFTSVPVIHKFHIKNHIAY